MQRSSVTRVPPARALITSLAMVSVLYSGCAPELVGGPGDDSLPGGKTDDGSALGPALEAVTAFRDDDRFVLRHRLDVAGTADHVVSMTDQPFSHRSRKWHVFPFASYGQATYRLRLDVADPHLAERSGVWLYGPQRSDGSWPTPREVTSHEGVAEITTDSSGYANWSVVVGPRHVHGFLPRYPGSKLTVGYEDSEGYWTEDDAYLVMETEDRVFLELDDGRRLAIIDPITAGGGGGDGAGSTDVIWAEDEDGEPKLFAADVWARSQWYIAEDGDDDELRLGLMNEYYEDVLTMVTSRAPHSFEDYLVLEALGPDGRQSDDPVVVTVVRDGYGDREITLAPDEKCDTANGGSCLVPMFIEDDGLHTVPDDVLAEVMTSFKATHIDMDEPSTYDLTISCEGTCAPAARPTRYPVYLAHGFNTTKASWDPVIEMLGADPAWHGWVSAGTVPGYEPVANRTEHLRRNLEAFLAELESAGVRPTGSDEYIRLNIIAHSMGGLDSRYLLGHEKFNNPECHARAECLAEDGSMEPCCPADLHGNAIQWQDRIVSTTTLSTPHCGSSFASWGMRQLAGRVMDWAFRKVAKWMFGMETTEEQDNLRGTLYALSKEFCEEVMEPDFHEPVEDRTYDWACATGQESCDASTLPVEPFHRPMADGVRSGGYLLPEPTTRPTFYSWGSQSCITGTCGDTLAPMLALPYRIVKGREGANDGVVATASSDFGIFMGIRNNDHFRWTQLRAAEGGLGGFMRSIFGSTSEPTDRWYRYWFAELARAGY